MDWEKLQTKVKKKIDAIGATMVVTTTTYSAFDVSEGVPVETSTDHTVNGLILNYSEKDIASGLAQVGDKQLLLNAKDLPNLNFYDSVKITIGMGDAISYILDEDGEFILDEDGEALIGEGISQALVLNPISVNLVSPGNVGLMYKIHARG